MGRLRCAPLFLLFLATAAFAGDVWTTPYEGLRYLRRTTTSPAWSIHVLEIDTQATGVRFISTTSAERKKTTGAWASLKGVQAAINGDFFNFTDYATVGLAAGNGVKWADTADTNFEGTLVFGVTPDTFDIRRAVELVTFDPTWMKGAVGGRPMVVLNGAILNNTGDHCTVRHPRTAVGQSQDGRYVYWAVVDGRQTASVGMTCAELGNLMLQVGSHRALSLDGGGSTTFILGGQVKNAPSDGSERMVANHLGVFANPVTPKGTLKGLIFEGSDSSNRLSGVNVKITGGPQLTTASDGVYQFQIAPGTYTVTASLAGYVTESLTRTVTSGADVWGSMGLDKVVVVDAGTPDAGMPEEDAGTPIVDAGAPEEDAGTPIVDAGVPEEDAGTIAPDAGEDAGTTAEEDAGFTMAPHNPDEMAPEENPNDPGPAVDAVGCSAPGVTDALGLLSLALVLLRRRKVMRA